MKNDNDIGQFSEKLNYIDNDDMRMIILYNNI